MGRTYTPRFDSTGHLDGLQASADHPTTRIGAPLERLVQIQDPGNSAAVFQAQIDAAAGKPGFTPDNGMKV